MAALRQLPPFLVNQIAAGEVVERPAAALKELIENALDADATQIDIESVDGGRSLLAVHDNGHGMAADDLTQAVDRHVTSKLPDDHLDNIVSYGFRGEALPAIGAVARLTIKTRRTDTPDASMIIVNGGDKSTVAPAARGVGTSVEVRELFYATPARLKFLKSAVVETNAVRDTVERMALVNPAVGFSLTVEGRSILNVPRNLLDQEAALAERVQKIMGADFIANSLPVFKTRDGFTLTGYISTPTYHRASTTRQFFYVNGRVIKDKMLPIAARVAYGDLVPKGRFPELVLFLTVPPAEVDINVHPAKTEVRFKDMNLVRGFIINAMGSALQTQAQFAPSHLAAKTLDVVHNKTSVFNAAQLQGNYSPRASGLREAAQLFTPAPSARSDIVSTDYHETLATHPLGAARAQLHENYIIAQTQYGMVIVDQHAAHERLVYEKLKMQATAGQVASQNLLIPIVVELPTILANQLLHQAAQLQTMGLTIEAFGDGVILVRSVPADVQDCDVAALVKDIADIIDAGDDSGLEARLLETYAKRACYGSVRSGRRLNADEMNALLRQMETTPNAGQCNHGRPTYIELQLSDIEKLFKRR